MRNLNIISAIDGKYMCYGDMRTKESILELEKMCQDIPENKRNTIIEIGAYRGESTTVFCKYFKSVIVIDAWKTGYDPTDRGSIENGKYIENDFNKNLSNYNNVHVIRKFSNEALDDVLTMLKDELADAIYIDAGHQYNDVTNDLNNYSNFVKTDGYICGDDYKPKYPGLMKAVDEFRNKEPYKYNKFVTYSNNSFVLQK